MAYCMPSTLEKGSKGMPSNCYDVFQRVFISIEICAETKEEIETITIVT